MSRNILDELYDYDLFHLTEIEDVNGDTSLLWTDLPKQKQSC